MLVKYTTTEVARTVSSYPVDAYPLLICLSVDQGQIDVVSVIDGSMSRAETIAQLAVSRKKFIARNELPHSKAVDGIVPSDQKQSLTTHFLKPCVKLSPTINEITMKFKKPHRKIIRIDEVENTAYLSEYLKQKMIIDTRLGNDQNERLLFHGCSRSAAEEIIQNGLYHKLIGTHGTLYGHGFYFSSDPNLSHCYTVPNNGERTILACRVLVGRTCQGHTDMRVCPNGYDSTTDERKIYVVYSNTQILPEYLITYKENGDTNERRIPYSNKLHTSKYCTIL